MSYVALALSMLIGILSSLFEPAPKDGASVRKHLSWAGKCLLVLSIVSGSTGIYLAWRSDRDKQFAANSAKSEASKAIEAQRLVQTKLTSAEGQISLLRQVVEDRATLMSGLMLGRITQRPQAQLRIITTLTPKPPDIHDSQVEYLSSLLFPSLAPILPHTNQKVIGMHADFGDLTAPVSNPFDEVTSNEWSASVYIDSKVTGWSDAEGFGFAGYSQLNETGEKRYSVVRSHFLEPTATRVSASKDTFNVVGLGLTISAYHSLPISSALLFPAREAGNEAGSMSIKVSRPPESATLLALDEDFRRKIKLVTMWFLIDEKSGTCGAYILSVGKSTYNTQTGMIQVPFLISDFPRQLRTCTKFMFNSAETYEAMRVDRKVAMP